MQITKAILAVVAIVPLASALSGCSSAFIDRRVGYELVSLAEANQVANCQSKGKVTVTVVSKVGFIDRNTEAVDANLLQLARNAAVDAGGDTVVKGERPDAGTQTFAMYKCR